MNTNWSLKELFKDFNGEEYKCSMDKCKSVIGEINDLATKINGSSDYKGNLETYINKLIELENLFGRMGAYISLRISTNSRDLEALKQYDVIQRVSTEVVAAKSSLDKWISTIVDLDKIIESSELLKEHEFILKEIVDNGRYLLSDKEEKLIASMQNTGSNAWSKMKDRIIASHKVQIEIDGEEKELPLTVVLNMAHHKDGAIRKKAYEAEIASYKKIEEGVAAALNGIKGEVLTVSKLRGYESPLHQTLINSRMDKESLDAMLEAITESLPSFRKYLTRKAQILGYKNGLPFYDMYAPIVEAKMEFTYEEACETVIKYFKTFSDNLSNYAKNAMEKSWIDAMPKEGKRAGAFCSNIHSIGESRVLLNFGGTLSGVVTLAHELGHGFHGQCLKEQSPLNSKYPMPIAETASIFCETILKKQIVKDKSKEQRLAILEQELGKENQVIVDIYSRFLFEKALFEKRETSALSVEEIKELMVNAQKEAYGEGLDQTCLHPYMWTWKPHFYYASRNFYNFPYAFGLLFAKGLYAEFEKRGESFPAEYEELLSVTGKHNIADITNIIGIDIRNKEFWKSSLKTIEEDIEQFIKLTDELVK